MSIYHKDNLKFVQESVTSILNQTYANFHFYLVIDGPVKEVVDRFISGLSDNRLRLFRLNNNMGLAYALNLLISNILTNEGYRFIARMDADDFSLPERFCKQRDFLISNSDISCVGTWYLEIDEEGSVISNRKLPTKWEDLQQYYFKRTPLVHPSVMFRRELIEKIGPYPEDTPYLEDCVLWGRSILAGLKFTNIPEYLFKFRVDRDFYKRRTGFKYGINYINTKLKIATALKTPAFRYILIISGGILRMFPSIILRLLYRLAR